MGGFMEYLRLKEQLLYDGSQIKPQWAFREFKIKDSSIITWIGPMDIHQDNIIDCEDQGKEIKGDELLHFIIEHFDSQPADIRLCYHRQRIFIMIAQDMLEHHKLKTLREGDDLYHITSAGKKAKLSVSIATCSNNSMKIHFAMNITNVGTPSDIKTTGLEECIENLDIDKIFQMADNICKNYVNELKAIERDICKTKVF
jgi:uncharacterized protein